MRAVAPSVAEVVAAELEFVGCQQLLGTLIVDRRPLELEEQELGLQLRGSLLHVLEERATRGIGRIGGEAQRGVRTGLADQLVDLRERSHGRGQPLGIELADATLVALGEGVRLRQGLGELTLDAGIRLAVDQRGEVPLGLEQLGIGEGVGGGGHGEGG